MNEIDINSDCLGPFDYRNSELYNLREADSSKSELARYRLFQQIVDHQYHEGRKILPLEKTSIALTCVMAGGLGDLSQTVRCAEALEQEFPHQVSVIADSHGVGQDALQQVFQNRKLAFFSGDYFAREKQLVSLNQSSGCILGLAVPIGSPDLQANPSYRSLREYGYSFMPETRELGNGLCMGLGRLDEGLIIPSANACCLHEMRTEWVKKALGIDSPESEQFYLQNRKLYHMYLPSWHMQMLGLYTIGYIESGNENPIDIVLPFSYTLNQLKDWGFLNPEILKRCGIGKVTLVKPGFTESLELGEGKEVQILAHSVERADMAALQKYSQPFFGCTGDASVSEAIAFNKLFLYDEADHKVNFAESLEQLMSEKNLPTLSAFQKELTAHRLEKNQIYDRHTPQRRGFYQPDPSYELKDTGSIPRLAAADLSAGLEQRAQRIASLYVTSPALVREAAQFDTYIVKNRNIMPRILAMVDRGLVMTNYPQFSGLEKTLWSRFQSGNFSEEEVVQSMRAAFSECAQNLSS